MDPSCTGRAALRAASGDHLLARFLPSDASTPVYQRDGALVWAHAGRGYGLGEPVAAARLGAQLTVHRVDVPRLPDGLASELFAEGSALSWEVRATTTAPAVTALEDRVRQLGPHRHRAINAVLDEVLGYTRNRPGHADIRAWYGIVEGDRLVAVGAERSRNQVGYIVAVAVAAGRQGRGYGAAVTAAITRRLLSEFDVCALGVLGDNVRAQRHFAQLGYTTRYPRTAITRRSID